ncbi:hypothetical protein CPC08DRAFT_793135 [Agrocybe pediades]|nr:hypothetical protein CPC08DRAFT_793135 [Agrocybe pediades]
MLAHSYSSSPPSPSPPLLGGASWSIARAAVLVVVRRRQQGGAGGRGRWRWCSSLSSVAGVRLMLVKVGTVLVLVLARWDAGAARGLMLVVVAVATKAWWMEVAAVANLEAWWMAEVAMDAPGGWCKWPARGGGGDGGEGDFCKPQIVNQKSCGMAAKVYILCDARPSLCARLSPDILKTCSLKDIDRFVWLCHHFRQEIRLYVPLGSKRPPFRLPAHIEEFLAGVLSLDGLILAGLWKGLQDTIWELEDRQKSYLTDEEVAAINAVGKSILKPESRLAATMFYPPVDRCFSCKEKLKAISRVLIWVYSANGIGSFNASEGYSTSLRCKGCKIRYYHNYYVKDSMRHFYSADMPEFVQIEEHAFAETELSESFTTLMLFAWVSSQNCANVLNASVACHRSLMRREDISISSEQVFRTFVMNALLRDSAERGTALLLPDLGDHDDRLKAAMEMRNLRVIQEGQKERMHACHKCEKPINVHFTHVLLMALPRADLVARCITAKYRYQAIDVRNRQQAQPDSEPEVAEPVRVWQRSSSTAFVLVEGAPTGNSAGSGGMGKSWEGPGSGSSILGDDGEDAGDLMGLLGGGTVGVGGIRIASSTVLVSGNRSAQTSVMVSQSLGMSFLHPSQCEKGPGALHRS